MTNLPNGWQYKTLGEVAKWGSGGTPRAGTKSFYDGDIPWAIIGDLNDSYVTQTARTITQKGLDESSAKMVPVGAVLIAMYGSIGKLGMNTIPMATNQAIAFAIPKSELVLQKYLFHYLSSQREIFLWSGKGATQQNISQTLLKAWKIPLPPLPEQQKIVEILEDHLSRLDAALADVKQAKLKAAQFRRSLLQSAFTGNLTGDGTRLMTDLPNGWSNESINSIVEGGMIADGDWVESKDQDPNGQVRLTQLADVGDGEFRSRSDRWMNDEQALRLNVNYLQPGDLLMARMPDPLGRTCMVPENIGRAVTVVDVAIIRITRKDLNPKFVMWLLNSPGIRQQIEMLASGTTRRRITRKNLGTIDLPIPPIDEQNKIVEILEDYLSRLDASVAIADAMEKQSSSLRRSLLQAAFTGQLTKEVASV
jgi:type I restriction enzyme S subunit